MVHWYSRGTVYTVQCTMHIIKDCSRGIIFRLPQNEIYRIVGSGKHAYYNMPYVMLTKHVTSSNYMAQKPSNFYIFYLMQKIDYILTKKRKL